MPDELPLIETREADIEHESAPDPEARWTDEYAQAVVKRVFENYKADRSGVEERWALADELWSGVVAKSFWPGTKVERHTLDVSIALEQEEAAAGYLESQIFAEFPYWFRLLAVDGQSSPEEAQQAQARLAWHLNTPLGLDGLAPVQHVAQALDQIVHLGNGGVELGWLSDEGRLLVRWQDIKDLYVDPDTYSPSIDTSPAVVQVFKITVQELQDLAAQDVRIKLPSEEELFSVAGQSGADRADEIRKNLAALGGQAALNPAREPRHKTLKVYAYWTPQRQIWSLDLRRVVLNVRNDYEFIPFALGAYVFAPGRFWGDGVPWLVRNEQRLARGLRNSRLDELALALSPHRVRRRGGMVSNALLAMRPNLIEQVEDPRRDVVVTFPSNITQSALIEQQLTEQRAQSITGLSSLVVQGQPVQSSANRTAAGIRAQQSGVSLRLYKPIRRIEDYLIVPLLYKCLALLSKYEPDQVLEGMGPKGESVPVPRAVIDKKFRVQVLAASRMLNQQGLAAIVGPVLQTLVNGPVMSIAAQQGKALDFNVLERFIGDATGSRQYYKFYRAMNEQEQAATQQPSPELQAEQQRAQMEAQTRLQMGELKAKSLQDVQSGKESVELVKLLLSGGETKGKSAKE